MSREAIVGAGSLAGAAKSVRVVAGLFALAGSVLLVVAGYGSVQSLRATLWRDTEATILTSKIEPREHSGEKPSLHFVLSYRYPVDGFAQTGTRVAYGHFPFRWQLKDLLREYPPGSVHRVWYDPADPATSTLKAGLHSGLFLQSMLSVLFMTGGGYGLWWSMRRDA